jgi:hypothetical protein
LQSATETGNFFPGPAEENRFLPQGAAASILGSIVFFVIFEATAGACPT